MTTVAKVAKTEDAYDRSLYSVKNDAVRAIEDAGKLLTAAIERQMSFVVEMTFASREVRELQMLLSARNALERALTLSYRAA